MPEHFLSSLDADQRGSWWSESLRRGGGGGVSIGPNGDLAMALVAEDDREIVGVATVGSVRGDAGEGVGELYMINVAPEAWGRGIGRSLLEQSMRELRRRGYGEAILWVLDSNYRARRFYEQAGWSADGAERVDETRGFPVRELRYRRSL